MYSFGLFSPLCFEKHYSALLSPVFGRLFLFFVLFFALCSCILVSNDVRDQLKCSLSDWHNLLDGLKFILRWVNSCMLGHHIAIIWGIRATWRLEQKLDVINQSCDDMQGHPTLRWERAKKKKSSQPTSLLCYKIESHLSVQSLKRL